jgi:WS/DGAT/MGAT family acyltransferase
MPHYSYERLTAESASFLAAERSTSFAHAASVLVFENGPLATQHGGVDIDAIKRAIASQLHRSARYRQKLRWIPFERHPVWVDDPHFNLDYHVRHTSLPRPGTREQLRQQVARIHAQRLDRSRPFWECWVLEGLEGDRFALLMKTHHSMVEDDSGPDLLQLVLSPEPRQALPEGPPYLPRPMPSSRELLVDEIARRARLPFEVLERLRTLAVGAPGLREELLARAGALARLLGYTLRRADETPLNGRIGPHRLFRELAFPFDAVRDVHRALGATITDVVLATLAGALRSYFADRLVNPSVLDFRVGLPVSVQQGDPETGLPDRLVEWLIELPLWERAAARRLAAISAQTERRARSDHALPAQALANAGIWIGSRMLSLGARAAPRQPRAHLALTHVPGPRAPLYLLGSRLLEGYGLGPLRPNQALGVAVFSCAGQLFWGLNADYDLVPDLDRLAAYLQASFAELQRAALQPRLQVVRSDRSS